MRYPICGLGAALLAAAVAMAQPASAHVTLENREVKPGATVKFVLRVPHGCAGSPTTAIRLLIPDALTDAKPQPKPGWTLTVVAGEAHGHAGDDGHKHGASGPVKEIAWSGGRLEDAHYDEFVFRASVSKTASGTIHVPIVQECESGVERWIEIPSAGGSADSLKSPAAAVRVQP